MAKQRWTAVETALYPATLDLSRVCALDLVNKGSGLDFGKELMGG